MKFKIIIFFLILSGLGFTQEISENAGSSGYLFLRSNISSRTAALGNAFTGLADDNNAIYYNPAGLIKTDKIHVSLNHTEWFESIRFENISATARINNKFSAGLAFSHMWISGIEGFDEFGDPAPDVNVSSSVMNLSAAYAVYFGTYIGINLKYFSETLAQNQSGGFAVDLGYYMYTAVKNLSLGLAVQNLGSAAKHAEDQIDLPLTYRAGVAYKIEAANLNLALDFIKYTDSGAGFAIGVEYSFADQYFLRAGNEIREFDSLNLSAGFGAEILNFMRINYSLAEPGELGFVHYIGFDFKIDKKLTDIL